MRRLLWGKLSKLALHRLLVSAIKPRGGQLKDIDEDELVVRAAGDRAVKTTYAALESA
jgi:hypothetical protein